LLEGNVIDLGTYKLQVVEACSGLRYLFPLLTLGFIVASLVPTRLWIRAVLVASTVPITILMNSFRIGVIGVLVDRHGISQAEGFLHDFEGWVIFMSCFALLLLETWVLLRITGDKRNFRDLLSGQFSQQTPAERPALATPRRWGVAPFAAVGLVVLALWPAIALPERTEMRPDRDDLTGFPMRMADWEGRRDRIEGQILDELKLDDYVLADYVRPGDLPVNFYVAYYASQRSGQAAHSPSSCLPGAGWRISEFGTRGIPGIRRAGEPLNVNRAVIQLGEQRQLVYYWFQQRGRDITNEYAVKWFLLWDSLRMNRTDGALVRLVTPLRKGEPIEAADRRLMDFALDAAPRLSGYIPD
jgi:exosortase D (VPLPA-CTERM-specific)